MAKKSKITVILAPKEFDRFDVYCEKMGFKKSTLIARLIKAHLDEEKFPPQGQLFDRSEVGQ
jgi:hypothetical protein